MINCFLDSLVNEPSTHFNLHFHEIDDKAFIEALISCKALISTAGYETICEAMYLGKPVLMVPVRNHFEQYLNSIFFEKSGAGFRSNFYDINKLLNFTLSFKPVIGLKNWTDKGPTIIEKQISALLNNKSEN